MIGSAIWWPRGLDPVRLDSVRSKVAAAVRASDGEAARLEAESARLGLGWWRGGSFTPPARGFARVAPAPRPVVEALPAGVRAWWAWTAAGFDRWPSVFVVVGWALVVAVLAGLAPIAAVGWAASWLVRRCR